MASGSEVELCVKAKAVLKLKGVQARVVSMPCMEVFDKQTQAYKDNVIPKDVKARICVEAGTAHSWYKYAGEQGEIIAMDSFGASAPAGVLFPHFGFTVDNILEKALLLIEANKE